MKMDVPTQEKWFEDNQRYLIAALGEVRQALEQRAAEHHDLSEEFDATRNTSITPEAIATEMSSPPAVARLCSLFNLSSFERMILLLCAGIEFDPTFASLCASAYQDLTFPFPTFSLALSTFSQAHWSALSPEAPLRYWRLLEVGGDNGLLVSPLRIDERVLHFLAGVQYLDDRLVGYVEPLRIEVELVPSHQKLTSQITSAWSRVGPHSPLPVIQLSGKDVEAQRAIASAACDALGLNLYYAMPQSLPVDTREVGAFLRLWDREATLSTSALFLDCCELDSGDHARMYAARRAIEGIQSPLFVASVEKRPLAGRSVFSQEVPPPTPSEQYEVWMESLGHNAVRMNGEVENLIAQFNLSARTIRSVCAQLAGSAGGGSAGYGQKATDFADLLWDTCRVHARPHMENLAQKIVPLARWDDLVLPQFQKQLLQEVALHVRHRLQVYQAWGFAAKSSRGLGISALFSGPSGTGKTMAAEVLANELHLDLYRIDLSQVVSKYIGETEKNLRRIFDAAERGGAILLFDEADALFGRRSEVKDSHDRYANIEISYLLQRMEEYRGLAILTTNMKHALDRAFLRRIRFVVQFPFPDVQQRTEIWRRIMPEQTPVLHLDMEKLARLNITGGNIRNIALYAAFLAADENHPIDMNHLLQAARVEYAKLEKPLSDSETRGWIP